MADIYCLEKYLSLWQNTQDKIHNQNCLSCERS